METLKVLQDLKECEPVSRVSIYTPTDCHFVCHLEVFSEYRAAIEAVPGVVGEEGQFDSECFEIDCDKWTPESEAMLLQVCREFKAKLNFECEVVSEYEKLRGSLGNDWDAEWDLARKNVEDRHGGAV